MEYEDTYNVGPRSRSYGVEVNGQPFVVQATNEQLAIEEACLRYLEQTEELLQVKVNGGREYEVEYDFSLFLKEKE